MAWAPQRFNPVTGRPAGALNPGEGAAGEQAYRQLEEEDWNLSALVDLLVERRFPEQLQHRARGFAGLTYAALLSSEQCSYRAIGRAAKRYIVGEKVPANDYGRFALENEDGALLAADLAALWFPGETQFEALGLAAGIYWTLQEQESLPSERRVQSSIQKDVLN